MWVLRNQAGIHFATSMTLAQGSIVGRNRVPPVERAGIFPGPG